MLCMKRTCALNCEILNFKQKMMCIKSSDVVMLCIQPKMLWLKKQDVVFQV